jgi:probable rRNA maturation factor
MKNLNCLDKEISLLLVDNESICEMNRTYLGRDCPTNVIAFPLACGEHGNINPHVLGDVVISVERASTDAGDGGITLEDALDFLMIHGLLHLLGYDHERSGVDEGEKMRCKEEEIFTMLKGYSLTTAELIEMP